jgi:hypothetical protein
MSTTVIWAPDCIDLQRPSAQQPLSQSSEVAGSVHRKAVTVVKLFNYLALIEGMIGQCTQYTSLLLSLFSQLVVW